MIVYIIAPRDGFKLPKSALVLGRKDHTIGPAGGYCPRRFSHNIASVSPVHSNRIFRCALLAVLALILATGLMTLDYPLYGDQALFMVGVQKLDSVGLLYKDFWDLKPPGIFYFYRAGAMLFGSTERGLHLFELLFHLFGAVAIACTLKKHGGHPLLGPLAALLSVWVYYAVGQINMMTQLEGLVYPFLLLAAVFFGEAADAGGARWLALAGASSGVLFWSKPVLILIPAGFGLLYLLKTRTLRRMWPLAAGFSLMTVAMLAPFYSEGTLREALWTCLIYPGRYVTELTRQPLRLLLESTGWWVVNEQAWIAAAMLPLWAVLRGREKRLLPRMMAVWLVLAAVIIVVQTRSWWSYHFLLLFAPVGILASFGLVSLTSRMKLHPAVAIAAFLVLLTPALAKLRGKTAGWSLKVLAGDAASIRRFQQVQSPLYGAVERDLARFGPPVRQMVCAGDPVVIFRANAKQAVPLQSWSPENYVDQQWADLADQWEAHAPSTIVLTPEYAGLVLSRSPRIAKLLESRYTLAVEGETGSWYRRLDAVAVKDERTPGGS